MAVTTKYNASFVPPATFTNATCEANEANSIDAYIDDDGDLSLCIRHSDGERFVWLRPADALVFAHNLLAIVERGEAWA